MIPDYFNFLLTGVKMNEYTEATTGQLISPKTNEDERVYRGYDRAADQSEDQ